MSDVQHINAHSVATTSGVQTPGVASVSSVSKWDQITLKEELGRHKLEPRRPVETTAKGTKIYSENNVFTDYEVPSQSKQFNNSDYQAFMKKVVLAKGFSPDEQKTIKNTLKKLYFGSPTAKKMFDEYDSKMYDGSDEKIVFGKGERGFYSNKNKGIPDLFGGYSTGVRYIGRDDCDQMIFLNYAQISGRTFKNQNGHHVELGQTRVMAHELTHLLLKRKDNISKDDLMGDTVRHTNKIMGELGSFDQRVDYRHSFHKSDL